MIVWESIVILSIHLFQVNFTSMLHKLHVDQLLLYKFLLLSREIFYYVFGLISDEFGQANFNCGCGPIWQKSKFCIP